jgi:hypothetical protein
MVIARRGLGIKEKKTFTVIPKVKKKDILNLEGRGISIALTQKAYSYLENCFLKIKLASLTETPLNLGSSTGGRVGEIPTSESCITTGRTGNNNLISDEERHPSILG